MVVDIGQLRQRERPLFLDLLLSTRHLALDRSSCLLKGSARAQLKLSLLGDTVRVRGAISADLEVFCSRCLKRFGEPLEKEVTLEYHPDPVREEEGEDIELSYSELNVGFYRDDQLDLGVTVGEQIVLDLPMKPVCVETCEGLCDQCGHDLNDGPCSCCTQPLDPRLAMLAELKLKMNRKQ